MSGIANHSVIYRMSDWQHFIAFIIPRDREIEVWNPSGRFIMEEAALPLRQLLHSIAGSGTWKRSLHSSIKIRDSTNGYASDSTTSSPTAPVTTSRRAASGRATNSRRTSAVKKEESDAEDDMSTSERIGMTSLRKTFDNMSMKAIKKITPDRVYSLAVHPTTDKDLVFVGDRKGWMGIWNASADAAEEEAKPEEVEEQSYDAHAFAQRVYNDHGTIACMRFDPLQAHT